MFYNNHNRTFGLPLLRRRDREMPSRKARNERGRLTRRRTQHKRRKRHKRTTQHKRTSKLHKRRMLQFTPIILSLRSEEKVILIYIYFLSSSSSVCCCCCKTFCQLSSSFELTVKHTQTPASNDTTQGDAFVPKEGMYRSCYRLLFRLDL